MLPRLDGIEVCRRIRQRSQAPIIMLAAKAGEVDRVGLVDTHFARVVTGVYKLAFATLGCPGWSWHQIVEQAAAMGYQGIEVRGVAGEMDLPTATPFVAENLEKTRRQLAGKGLAVCCLGSSVRFDDARKMEENLASGRAYIDLAERLSAPYVRVFGDAIPDPVMEETITDQVVEGLEHLGAYAEGRGVQVLIESHGDFSRSRRLAAVMERVQSPAVGVLWDMHHPWRFHGESLEETFAAIGPWVRHVHLKDSVRTEDGFRYTLPKDGEFPWEEALALLERAGYRGWLSFEWEKKWHPEIEPPEEAFPRFVKVVRELGW